MRFKDLSVATMVAAFAAGSFPAVVLPTVAAAANQECGYRNEGGTLVFLGSCAHDTSEGTNSEPTTAPPTNPCVGKLIGGPVFSYRVELAGC